MRAKQLDIAGVEEQMAKLDSMLKEARGQTEKVQKEYNTMSEQVRCCGANMLHWRLHSVLHQSIPAAAQRAPLEHPCWADMNC